MAGRFRECVSFTAIEHIAQRIVITTFQQERAYSGAELDSRSAAKPPIELLFGLPMYVVRPDGSRSGSRH